MSNTLTGFSPAATRGQLLHIGSGVLATGAIVRLGDGTATPLTISSTGLAVDGSLSATTMSLGGVPLKAPVWKRLTADILATDTNNVALNELDFTPENGAVYEVELMVIGLAAATAGALQIVNTGGAGTLVLMDSATALGISATGGSYAPTTSPVAGTFVVLLKGIFIASSTANLTFAIKSDDTNDVTAKIGTYLRATKL
jgi:hypothetical protein